MLKIISQNLDTTTLLNRDMIRLEQGDSEWEQHQGLNPENTQTTNQNPYSGLSQIQARLAVIGRTMNELQKQFKDLGEEIIYSK